MYVCICMHIFIHIYIYIYTYLYIYIHKYIGMKYDAFPAHTHMGLLHTIENRIVLMSPDGIIMTLLGLGKLGVKWGSMPIGVF
jgi:hypothetical protein